MVEVHAAPRVAIRSSAKSAQSIVVVCFLILLLYIFFSGGRASERLEKASKNLGKVGKNIGGAFSSREKPSTSSSNRGDRREATAPDSDVSSDSGQDSPRPRKRSQKAEEGKRDNKQTSQEEDHQQAVREKHHSKSSDRSPSRSDTTPISTSDTSASTAEQDRRRQERRKRREEKEKEKREKEKRDSERRDKGRRDREKRASENVTESDTNETKERSNQEQKEKDREAKKKKEQEKQKKKEKKARKQQQVEYEKPDSSPNLTPLPDHRSAKPKRSIHRRRGSDDSVTPSRNSSSGSHVSWSDEEGQSPHPVRKHFRKWGDYVGLTEDKASFENKPEEIEPKWQTHRKLPVDPAERCAKALRGKGVLEDGVLKLMEEAEVVAMAKPREKHWIQALNDQWDDHHGSIPAVAVMMSQELSKLITLNDIELLETVLEARKSAKKATKPKLDTGIDKKRDYGKFKDRVGVRPDDPLFVYKFILAWYCEHYRCRYYDERMGISEEPVPMMSDPKLDKTAQILGWMEYLGRLNMGQRLFIGLDLYGLSMRAQAMREGDGYRLDLTVFMPGGPPEKPENDPMKEWAIKLEDSGKAFRTIHLELATMLYKTEDVTMLKDPFVRRRLIFRPGWSLRGVRSDKLGKPEPERSVAQRTLIKRPSEVLAIPSNINERITRALRKPSKNVRNALSRLSPGEVCFQSIRQYAWDKNSVTPENSKLTPLTFWIAWSFSGERMQESKGPADVQQDQRNHDFVRSIDLGGYIPLFKLQPPRFVPINGFPALEVLVLSYVPLGRAGATAELLLDKDYGLFDELKKIKEPTRHLSKQATKLRLFISIADARSSRSIIEDLDKKLAEEGRRQLVGGKSPDQAVINMRGLARDALGEAFLVDEAQAGNAEEGLLPKGIPLRYDPTGAEKSLGIGKNHQPPAVDESGQAPPSESSDTPAIPADPPAPLAEEGKANQPPGPPPPAPVHLPSPTSELSGANLGGQPKRVPSAPVDPIPTGRSAGAAAEARRRALENEREAQPSPVDRRVNGESVNQDGQTGYISPTVEDDPEGDESDVPKDKKSRFGRLRDIENIFRGGGGGK
ncbi:hypothetical protein L202_04197 [Cryptococcus amylolentus CBS 6039]|uniref:Transmembrane protein n=1 Tax=Cryptococcus amylolentus CBS 6039 TaxID=1295533 RepID=A0A1E3HQF3_9TREE|nr:hypothetical protein L202_04197 [Cryptococcus amylolentus CBS 6039]ODN78590.1 hypothetical protein L202_04197 [Cryptococcus amylolentus CBS 6039]